MLRKCVCLLCTLWLFPLTQVLAAEGSVRIMPVWAGEPVAGGMVSVQRIGSKEEDKIILTDGLADWCVTVEDILDGAWDLEEISRIRSGIVEEGEGAVFSGLEEGVYLVRQEESVPGYLAFRPFLLSLPENGRWDVLRMPSLIREGQPPETGDQPAPIIGAMGIGLSVAFLMVLADKFSR